MIKKIVIIFCLIIGVSLFCCAKIFNKKNLPQKTIVQFATWGSESEVKILKPIIADFETENPNIKIDFMHIPQNYFQKIHLLFASNTAPDVIFINNHYLPIYANAGVLEDLTPYEQDFEYDKFYPKSLNALSWENKIYAIPRDISTLVVFYNKNIFDKYNIPYPKTGWSFDNFLETAQKLTHLPEIFGISFDEDPLFYLPYLTAFNTTHFDNFKDTNMQNGIKFYANLRKKYHIAPRKEESASATMAQMFLQQRLAMHLSGRWLVPKYRQEANFDWDIIEFPQRKSGYGVPLDASGWAISKSSKNKAEAILFIKYLSSQKSIEKLTESGLITPARIKVANSPVFLDNKKPLNAKAFLTVIDNSIPTPVTVDFKKILDNLKNKTEEIFN